ncbi:MAG: hypothetical protein AAF383_11915 [Cyanobacteria bacterium P01_A01_bin.83]
MNKQKQFKIINITLLFLIFFLAFSNRYRSWSISGTGEVISFSNNGQMIAYATGKQTSKQINPEPEKGKASVQGSSQIEVRTVNNDKIIQTFDFFSASSIAFSPDDTLMAVGGYGGEIKIWRIQNGELIYTLRNAEHYKDKTKTLLFTPDGKTLISSTISHSDSQYRNSNISVWNLERGVNINTVYQPFTCAAISSDGQLFALGGNKSIITIHRTKDNVPIQHLDDFQEKNPHFCNELIFSHDNQLLVSTGSSRRQDNVFVHRVSDGKLLRATHQVSLFRRHHSPTDTKLSPNSNFIATSYSVKPAGGGSLFINSPNFEVSIGLFGHINFWHLKSGFPFPLATIRAHWRKANAIAFSPDGKWLASMSGSRKNHNRVRLWRMPPYSGWWWFLGSIALVVWVFRYKNELQEWINR